jgi:putative hydrolase of HD superfamily
MNQIFTFLQEAEKLKTIARKVYNSDGRAESDAEHSWNLALMIMLYGNKLNINMEKSLKLAIIHDLVEVYAGDAFAFCEKERVGKKEREERAAQKLFTILPEEQKQEMFDLFHEYENQTSREAKVVRSIDKMQPILQNLYSNGKGWKDHYVSLEIINTYKRKHMEHDPFILELYEQIMQEAQKWFEKNKDIIQQNKHKEY